MTLINAKSTMYSFIIKVLAHSRYTLNINEIVVLRMLHPDDGTVGYQVSMTVQTTDSSVFVAERQMYWNVNGTQSGDDVLGYTGGQVHDQISHSSLCLDFSEEERLS